MSYIAILEKLSKIAGTDKLETYISGSEHYTGVTFYNNDVCIEVGYSYEKDQFQVNYNAIIRTYELGSDGYGLCKQIIDKVCDESKHSAKMAEKFFVGIEE